MNQPPRSIPKALPAPTTRPDWLRPTGVAEGTWAYTQQRSIADHYGDFVAGTPLCSLDQHFVGQHFPTRNTSGGNQQSCRIIDFGCGNGRSLIPLAAKGYETIGVDLSQSMLANAAQNAARATRQADVAAAMRWVRANLVELDCFADRSADHGICLFSTLGMIQGRVHRRQFLQHARRIVADGGSFVLHVHNVWSAIAEPGGPMRLSGSAWKSLTIPEHDFGDHVYAYRGLSNMFLHRFRWSELERDLSDSGWDVAQKHLVAADGNSFVDAKWYRPDQVGGFIVVAK